MMDVANWKLVTVTDVSFEGLMEDDGSITNYFTIRYETEDGEEGVIRIHNGGYVPTNYTLQFLAYHGYRPSTAEDMIGDQITLVDEPNPSPPQMVFENGKRNLRQSEWFA